LFETPSSYSFWIMHVFTVLYLCVAPSWGFWSFWVSFLFPFSLKICNLFEHTMPCIYFPIPGSKQKYLLVKKKKRKSKCMSDAHEIFWKAQLSNSVWAYILWACHTDSRICFKIKYLQGNERRKCFSCC